MLNITDLLFIKAQEEFNNHNLGYAYYEKLYTRADTPLTYRQLNILDTDKLLAESRKGKSNWRKFSFIELVYFDVLNELKKFGFEHKQLLHLRDSFFDIDKKKNLEKKHLIKAPIAITCVLGGINITLCIDSDGNISYFDPVTLLDFKEDRPVIRMSLNIFVNRLINAIKNGKLPAVESLKDIIQNKDNSKTDKEEKLLDYIRNNNYSSVKVKKTNGVISTVYAESYGKEGISTRELENIIDSKDYLNVELIRRDGKIVNYKIEETFKL